MMDRYRLPRWTNALIDWLADHPMSLPGRLAARRMGRPSPRGAVPSTVFDDRPTRVLIAPVNYSGQGREWARALEELDPDVSARNMAIDVPGGFAYEADLVVPVGTFHNDADWQRRQFNAAASATHVLIEACEPPFGRLLGRSVRSQVEALLNRGVDVAYLGHGTEVRLPSRHLSANPWSHYSDPQIYTPRLEALAERNLRLMTTSGRPVFVSTPDLLIDLPEAQWCPVVVDVDRWSTQRVERPVGSPLRVAHAPSVTAIKGTELILPALERLTEERVIELDLIRGTASADMPARFARADVVIDQIRIGSYGTAACEAMASGCVVVGHVSDQVRDLVEERTAQRLPIIEATADSIEEVLREIAARGPLPDERAVAQSFVRDVHDGRQSASVLMKHWIASDTSDNQEPEYHAPPR